MKPLDACGESFTLADQPARRSAPAAASPRVIRSVTLFHYAPALLLLIAAIADADQFSDPDLWGHIRFGQAAIAAGHLIRFDPYSYTAAGLPWHNHEWLTELLMGWLYNGLGVAGLKLWKFSCAAATAGLLAIALGATAAPATLQMNLLLLAALAIMPQMQFRPQLFSFVLLAAIIALLARYTYGGRAKLWLAVPIMLLWANLHGGFIMGTAAITIYAGATAAAGALQGRGCARGLRLGVLAACAFAATFATPYGTGTWLTVIHALRNPFTRTAVTDWQPMLLALAHQWRSSHAGVIYYICVLAIMALLITGLVVAPAIDDLGLAAIAAVMCAAAFVAARNMPLAVIASVVPAAHHLGLASRRRTAESAGHQGITAASSGGATPAACPDRSGVNQSLVAALAIGLALYLGLFSTHIADDSDYPSGAAAFMRNHHMRGNLLCDFGWGEYVIWHLAPEVKVFIDGRYDTVYPYSVINDYIDFHFARPGAGQVLERYHHDFVLIAPDAPVRPLIEWNPHWKLIYSDGASQLFARAEPAEAVASPRAAAGQPARNYFPG